MLALAVEPFGRLEVADERALGEWQSDPATASTFGGLAPALALRDARPSGLQTQRGELKGGSVQREVAGAVVFEDPTAYDDVADTLVRLLGQTW